MSAAPPRRRRALAQSHRHRSRPQPAPSAARVPSSSRAAKTEPARHAGHSWPAWHSILPKRLRPLGGVSLSSHVSLPIIPSALTPKDLRFVPGNGPSRRMAAVEEARRHEDGHSADGLDVLEGVLYQPSQPGRRERDAPAATDRRASIHSSYMRTSSGFSQIWLPTISRRASSGKAS